MDKADIVREIYERKNTSATMKDLAILVDEIFAVILEGLAKGEKVDIAGFGAFDLKDNAIKPLDHFAGPYGSKKAKA